MSSYTQKPLSQATLVAKADDYLDTHTGSITPPIYTSTTYARDNHYDLLNDANVYSRDDNPSFIQAERVLTELEQGENALLFASGMAAIACVFYTLDSGSHVVLPESMYWGVYNWTRIYCDRADIRISYYDPADTESIAKAMEGAARTSLVWIETPTNPMMHVTDIARAADIAHKAKARLVVDNTTSTPVFTQPLTLGADLVVHSATKSLNGHSDVLAGAIITRELDDAWQKIVAERHGAGAVISPFDAWLLLRGMRTLSLRVERAAQNAMELARRLSHHAAVTEVLYPGLESHPNHEIAKTQMTGGFGSLMSFLIDGDAEAARAVAGRLNLIVSATSLGGVETLIEHRHSVEPPETAVPVNLLRLAVGIESVDDLWDDLEQALG
ncbi:MAG: PLP-dependent aspartate aminotransferase family protein [Granulosicoccus sp.]